MDVQKESSWILGATKYKKKVTFAELNQLRRRNRHLPAYSASEKLQIVSFLERNCGITKSYLANPDAPNVKWCWFSQKCEGYSSQNVK